MRRIMHSEIRTCSIIAMHAAQWHNALEKSDVVDIILNTEVECEQRFINRTVFRLPDFGSELL